jgi:hypothetical protein
MTDTIPKHADNAERNPAVRFNSVTQEISPSEQSDSIHPAKITTGQDRDDQLSDAQKKDLRDISLSLQQSRIQSSRMDQFVFDPVSLPPSRVRLDKQLLELPFANLSPRFLLEDPQTMRPRQVASLLEIPPCLVTIHKLH